MLTNPILDEINGLSPGAKTALLNAHQANSLPTQNPAISAISTQRSLTAQPDMPVPKLMAPSQMPSAPPMMPPPTPPSVIAPKGTLQGDENERGRLLSTGSGVHQIHNPILKGLAGVGNAIGSIAAPGLMREIPGTEEHHNLLLGQNRANINNDLGIANKEASTAKLQADVPYEQAETENLLHPRDQFTPVPTASGIESFSRNTGTATPVSGENGQPLMPYVKPGPLQHVILQGPDGQPELGFVDPQRGITYGPDMKPTTDKPFEKAGADQHITVMHDGQPHVMGKDAQGNFTRDLGIAPPSFAMTGLWQPTEGVDPKTGQLVPGMLNERTGDFRTTAAPGSSPTALPKDVTSELSKELQTAREADKRLRIMRQNEASALNGDQQAMLSLVANHIGMTLGAQKGARINQAVWDEAVKSAPWLQNVKKQWGPDGLLEGVALSPQQVKQMVDLGEVVDQQQWKQAEQAFQQYGIPINGPTPEPGGGAQTQTFTDGGKTYRIPTDKVAEFKKDHPNAR